MINKLGLSNGLMKVMQTREKNDRVLLVVAVCFVLFVLYACVRYRRG